MSFPLHRCVKSRRPRSRHLSLISSNPIARIAQRAPRSNTSISAEQALLSRIYLYPIYSKFTDIITFSGRAIPPLRASAADIRSSTNTTDPRRYGRSHPPLRKSMSRLGILAITCGKSWIYTPGYGFGIGGPERSSAGWIHVRCYDLLVCCT